MGWLIVLPPKTKATKKGKEWANYEVLDQTLRGLPSGEWLSLRIVGQAGQVQLFVGQEPAPYLQALDLKPIEQGAIGLGAGFAEGVRDGMWEICFDNVRITAINP